MSTRKRCKACRLAKCFEKGKLRCGGKNFCTILDLGMRADWILTDEERLIKRQKIEENRRLRRMLYPDSPGSDEVRLNSSSFEILPSTNCFSSSQNISQPRMMTTILMLMMRTSYHHYLQHPPHLHRPHF